MYSPNRVPSDTGHGVRHPAIRTIAIRGIGTIEIRNVYKQKKPLTVSSKGFRVKKGTDLLSHLLRQYHRLWRA